MPEFLSAPSIERVPLIDEGFNLDNEDEDPINGYYDSESHKTSMQVIGLCIYMAAGMVSGWLISLIPTLVMALGGALSGLFLGALCMSVRKD